MKCRGAECKEGKEVCCLECKKYAKCRDKWKCDLPTPRPQCYQY